MPENEVIQQVIDSVKRDILANRSFMKSILADVRLTKENIDPNLILEIMSQFSAAQAPPKPKSNAPKEIAIGDKTVVARPIAVGQGSQASQIISDLLGGNNCYLLGKAGTGKAQPMSAKVLCENGWKTFAEIQKGDKVWGQDGKLYVVNGVFDRGLKPVYTVIFNDGGKTETCDEHLWKIQTRNDRNRKKDGSILQLSQFMNNIKTSSGHANAYIPVADAIPFAEKKHVVDPYLMGVLIGDGSLTQSSGLKITNPNEELFESLVLPESIELSDRNSNKRCLTYGLRAKKKNNDKNVITKELIKYNLAGKKSINKFIPAEYLYDSIENRVSLLQGLNDTDAYSDNKAFEFSTSSEQLSIDYCELVRSLGGTAKVISRIPSYTHNGIKKEGHLSYRIFCVFPENIIPFRLSYKKERYHKPTKYLPVRHFKSVEYKGLEPVRCISVTNPEHLYITDDYVVTHNTFLAKALAESVMGQPTFVINCSQWTSPIEIRGGQTIKGYQEGELIKAWEEGGVLILDELPKLDPNTAGLLNDALAESASQPKYDEKGKVIEKTIPYIVNGRGEKVYKGQKQTNPDLKFRFCCIATGNTDMMNVGNKYGGNQRQDYSLVDRFAGSFYYLEANPIQEMKLTYPYVYKICDAMRKFLDAKDAPQSISLRTMLNFNRTYEQEMLYKLGSKYADEIKDNDGNDVAPKSVDDAISSFLGMMEKNLREELELNADFREARRPENKNETDFIAQFRNKYKFDPVTGKEIDSIEPKAK